MATTATTTHRPRRFARAVAALTIGGILGTFGWHVAIAAPPTNDTLVVCQKPGNDLRSPATNGTCPSGYTLVEITETPPAPPASLPAYHAEANIKGTAVAAGADVVTLSVPAGTYTVVASGRSQYGAPVTTFCELINGQLQLDQTMLEDTPSSISHDTMSGVATVTGTGTLRVHCVFPFAQPTATDSTHIWQITATRVTALNPAI